MKAKFLKKFKGIRAGSIYTVKDMQIIVFNGRYTLGAIVQVQSGAKKIRLIAVPIDLLEFI